MNPTFRRLWLGQLISNLGTQCSLYGIGLWSFEQRGELLGFAAVAFVVQFAKVLVLPLLGRYMGSWPRRRLMLIANGIGASCTIVLAVQLLLPGHPQPLQLLQLLALAAMTEAALVLAFASLIPLLEADPQHLARANGLFVSSDGLVLSMAPFLGSALVARFGLAGVLLLDGLSSHPRWRELRLGSRLEGDPATGGRLELGLQDLLDHLRANSHDPALELEEALDRRSPGLGTELRWVLAGPASRVKAAVRAAFALHGPRAVDRLSSNPHTLVEELLAAIAELEAAARSPAAPQPDPIASGPRRSSSWSSPMAPRWRR